jgi:glycine/D-amino acid oxidase-like deaminating enzyme
MIERCLWTETALSPARALVELPPALEYAWGGQVGFTRSRLPATGRLDGIYYALGYCGHGVAMATYLGARVGQAISPGVSFPR